MGHTGRLRMIVLLGTVIKSAKPYTFSHVHAYVHKLSQCFKYLYNRCMGAFRNCHRVALCKCARDNAQVYKAGDYHVFPKKKPLHNFEKHGFTNENTFCNKKTLHGFKKTNTLHGST